MEPDKEPQAAGGYEWRYADAAGVTTDGPALAFRSQESAEAWLSESYQELIDDGIRAVSLFDGSRIRYGPMPLDPA